MGRDALPDFHLQDFYPRHKVDHPVWHTCDLQDDNRGYLSDPTSKCVSVTCWVLYKVFMWHAAINRCGFLNRFSSAQVSCCSGSNQRLGVDRIWSYFAFNLVTVYIGYILFPVTVDDDGFFGQEWS